MTEIDPDIFFELMYNIFASNLDGAIEVLKSNPNINLTNLSFNQRQLIREIHYDRLGTTKTQQLWTFLINNFKLDEYVLQKFYSKRPLHSRL